jgi:hypothetical protein
MTRVMHEQIQRQNIKNQLQGAESESFRGLEILYKKVVQKINNMKSEGEKAVNQMISAD